MGAPASAGDAGARKPQAIQPGGHRRVTLGGADQAFFNGRGGRVGLWFISAPAASGLNAFHMDDTVVRAKRAMMAAAGRCYLLINHARFGRSALHVLADLTTFDGIITDDDPPDGERAAIEKAGITLTVAKD